MRLLLITNDIPYPPMSGAPLRTYNILRRLARQHEVYLATFAAMEESKEGINHLREICKAVVTVKPRGLTRVKHLRKSITAILQGDPPEYRLAFSEEMAREIRRLVDRVEFDLVQIEHGSMGMYLEALPVRLHKRAVWILHDIDFDKFIRIARIERGKVKKTRAWLHAKMMRRWQPGFAGSFGLCVTMSEADRQLLLSANAGLRIEVSPNGVDTSQYHRLPEEGLTGEILLVGNMGYPPNVDAAAYFCREMLPLIRKEVADARLWIVGISPTASVRRLEGNGIVVVGGVTDVVPYYKRSTVCVAPLRAGSGTRLKVLEAMALGRPVVSTSLGCEGLDVIAGEHILIADDSNVFSEQIVKLLTRRELRTRIAARARELVVSRYDWDVIAEDLMTKLEGVARQAPSCNCWAN